MLREASGNAVFFSVYEYVRYHMHLQLKSASSDRKNLIDVGVGIVSGGLGGIAVCIFAFHSFAFLLREYFQIVIFLVPLLQFWSAVLPLDVAKTIIQTSRDKNSSRNPFQILSSVRTPLFLARCLPFSLQYSRDSTCLFFFFFPL